jgi:hypothetical protein
MFALYYDWATFKVPRELTQYCDGLVRRYPLFKKGTNCLQSF